MWSLKRNSKERYVRANVRGETWSGSEYFCHFREGEVRAHAYKKEKGDLPKGRDWGKLSPQKGGGEWLQTRGENSLRTYKEHRSGPVGDR